MNPDASHCSESLLTKKKNFLNGLQTKTKNILISYLTQVPGVHDSDSKVWRSHKS